MTRHVRRMLAAASITLSMIAMTAGPALATLSGPNGQITFQRWDADGHPQIWVANPDLTSQVQITDGEFGSSFPSWSPDSSRIVFQSDRTDPDVTDGYEIQDVFTMRPDGTDVLKITDSLGFSGHPSWSPDGRSILFDADRADYPTRQGIYIIPADGSAPPQRLTSLPAGSNWQELARFSPDGSRIVFNEGRGGNELRNHREGALVGEQAALFTMRSDGSDLRQITSWGLHGADADWSPDGRRLVFSSQPVHIGDIGTVMVIDADGTNPKDVTKDHGLTGIGQENAFWYEESFNAVWSPDGTKILFVHASYTAERGFTMGLQTSRPDGSDRTWVSEIHGEEHQPEWGTMPIVP
jgi:Tol biopolymer transport system component